MALLPELIDLSIDVLRYVLNKKGFEWVPVSDETFYRPVIHNAVRNAIKYFLFSFPVGVSDVRVPDEFDLYTGKLFVQERFFLIYKEVRNHPYWEPHEKLLVLIREVASVACAFTSIRHNHDLINTLASCLAYILHKHQAWMMVEGISWDDFGRKCYLTVLKYSSLSVSK